MIPVTPGGSSKVPDDYPSLSMTSGDYQSIPVAPPGSPDLPRLPAPQVPRSSKAPGDYPPRGSVTRRRPAADVIAEREPTGVILSSGRTVSVSRAPRGCDDHLRSTSRRLSAGRRGAMLWGREFCWALGWGERVSQRGRVRTTGG